MTLRGRGERAFDCSGVGRRGAPMVTMTRSLIRNALMDRDETSECATLSSRSALCKRRRHRRQDTRNRRDEDR